jgi:hypothetical protein
MMSNRAASQRRMERVALGRDPAIVVQFWFERWLSDWILPSWDSFDLTELGSLRDGMALQEVTTEGPIRCLLWGGSLALASGVDLLGRDLLEFTPEQMREVRRERYSRISAGCIGHSRKEAIHKSGFVELAEEVMLPFSDSRSNGSRLVLYYVNWRVSRHDPTKPEIVNAFDLPLQFEYIALDPGE